jgi:hypothetical protein
MIQCSRVYLSVRYALGGQGMYFKVKEHKEGRNGEKEGET